MMKNFLCLAGISLAAAQTICRSTREDLGDGNVVRVCNPGKTGDQCTYVCLNGSSRTITCTRSGWSSATACPPAPAPAPSPAPAPAPSPAPIIVEKASCATLAFDTGSGLVSVCPETADSNSCSFTCLNGDSRSTLCTDGTWSRMEACPEPKPEVDCAGVLFSLESQHLVNIENGVVAQDRPDPDGPRFRVEWVADTSVIPGTNNGHFQQMGECALDTAATLEELPIQLVSGRSCFNYNRGSKCWDFGPIFNPKYLIPTDSEPGILIAPDALGQVITQIIWTNKFVPAEPTTGPRFRFQIESNDALDGWPEDTLIEANSLFRIKIKGDPAIYTYTTSSGTFSYGTPATQNLSVVSAAGAVGAVGLLGLVLYMRRRSSAEPVAPEDLEEDLEDEIPELVDTKLIEDDFISQALTSTIEN